MLILAEEVRLFVIMMKETVSINYCMICLFGVKCAINRIYGSCFKLVGFATVGVPWSLFRPALSRLVCRGRCPGRFCHG